jgi:beta-phosphoglucomutase
MIKAVLFDLDGVLVDATEWHYEALNNALGLFGFSITRSDHFSAYNGLPTANKLKMMSERNNLPLGLHEVIKKMKQMYTDEKVALNCHPDHEKQIMLTHLKKKGFKLACCSNAQKYSVVNMLKRAQIDHFFDHIVGNDEGYKAKPDPEIYLETLKKMKIKPSETIIIEDAPHGIEAAKASGAKVFAVKGYQDVNLSLFTDVNLI